MFFFATRDIKNLDEFLLTKFIITTNMKDCFSEDNQEIRKDITDTMEGQFEHNLYNKFLNNQPESDETDTLLRRIEWCMMVVDRGGPILNSVYDNSFVDLFGLYVKL